MKTLIFLCFVFAAVSANFIPNEFLGRWKHDKDIKFDEYLESKGVSWFVRKMILFAGVTKVFAKDPNDAGSYVMENLTSKKNTKYEGVKLGHEFTAEGMDGKKHKITFSFNDGKLFEKHIRIEIDKTPEEVYKFFLKDDQLVMELENNGIVAQRIFKKA
ncbi:unnamed protein product, partial [Mesorhabditis belari]|uniref:Cytosolic fatty-acid binding proteins domain-containing protein n=1 Tax=Mesorhabditis belari TaxID=2138241 RepID=A0AAF3FB31_9BILA